MHWSDDRGYKDKLALLLKRIDAEKESVVLVGISAGASIVVPAFAKRPEKVSGVIAISGLLRLAPGDEEKVAFFDKAWFGAAKACEILLKKMDTNMLGRIVTFSPMRDSVIAPERARVTGATNRRVWSVGHVFSIGVILLLHARDIAEAARQLERRVLKRDNDRRIGG